MSKLKMSYLCFLVLLVGISLPMVFGEQNLTTYGSFDTNPIGTTDVNSIDGWGTWNAERDPEGSGLYMGNTEFYWDSTVGHDGLGSLRLDAKPSYWNYDPLEVGEEDNTGTAYGWWENEGDSCLIFTRVPCEEDKIYQVDGFWKGDFSIALDEEELHWMELRLNVWFQDENSVGDPNLYDMDEYWYERLSVVKYSTDPEKFGNTFPNEDAETGGVVQDTGQFDWLSFKDCRWDDDIEWSDDEEIVADVTGYMYIGIGFRIRHDKKIGSLGEQKVWVDDITVTACQGIETSDLNEDCQTTLADFVIVAEDWVDCGLDPATGVNNCP